MQPKPRVILDSSVVVSGIGWRGGDARKVLTLLAIGGFESYRTPWITVEWADAKVPKTSGLTDFKTAR